MAVQDFYENNVDFVENIICLCPTCHRKIHYAINSDKKEMLQILFKKRKQAYENKVLVLLYKTCISIMECEEKIYFSALKL